MDGHKRGRIRRGRGHNLFLPSFLPVRVFFSHFIRALNLACVGAMRVDVAGFQFRTVDGHQTLLRRITSWGHPYPRDVISSILNHSFLTRINTGHNLTAGSKTDQNERPSNSVSEWVSKWLDKWTVEEMNERNLDPKILSHPIPAQAGSLQLDSSLARFFPTKTWSCVVRMWFQFVVPAWCFHQRSHSANRPTIHP
jgi:hypothetical protein